MGRRSGITRDEVKGDIVQAVWMRQRGMILKDIAKVLGCSITWVHYLLKQAHEHENPPYPVDLSPDGLRVTDLPLPPFLRTILASRDIVMAKELAQMTVRQLCLIPNMGPTRIGRLYLTLREYGIEPHESWKMSVNGARYDPPTRTFHFRKESPVRPLYLFPYNKRYQWRP